MSRLPKFLMAMALAGSIGLHWALFQSVAWVGMVITYSQDGTLKEALAKTFDGKHPCSLCNKIAKAQKAQKRADPQFDCKRLEFVSAHQVIFLVPPHFHDNLCVGNDTAPLLLETPPVPPPRHI